MGYLFLTLALAAGITKAYCGKKTSTYTAGLKDAMFANSIRMLLCIGIGLVLILLQGELAFITPTPRLLLTAAFSGLTTAVFVVTWLLSVKKGAYMMVEVFVMLGVLIPMSLGGILFHESVRLTAWLGMGLLTAATMTMYSYNNTQKKKLTKTAVLLLVLCGIASGFADFSQKLFVRTLPEIPASVFNFYTYVFSALVLVPAFFLLSRKDGTGVLAKGNPLFSKIFGYIFVMSLCLFLNSYFKTLAAVHLDAAQLYPLNQGCALILSTFMSAFFKEKITLRCAIGLLLAFAGLILINVIK